MSSTLTIRQGKTYTGTVQLLVDGSAPNLTGFACRGSIRKSNKSTSDEILALPGSGDTNVVFADGADAIAATATITIDSVTSAALDTGDFWWEVEAYNTANPPIVYQLGTGEAFVIVELVV